MYIRVSYDQEFEDLLFYLRSKYNKKLFNLDGIGEEQLDMSSFSRNFFASNVTADVSIDANANVSDMSMIVYNNELPKPFFKLNSYFLLWKELKRIYSLEMANSIIEQQIIGDIYINDSHNVQLPYSYYGKSVIVIKNKNNDILYMNFEDLFSHYEHLTHLIEQIPEGIRINLTSLNLQIFENGKFVDLQYVLKHKTHCNLLKFETKNGFSTIVTEDHPVILNDFSEKRADEICLSDMMKQNDFTIPLRNNKNVGNDFSYFLGFVLGDGFISTKMKTETAFSKIYNHEKDISTQGYMIVQKNIKNHKIYTVANKLFDNVIYYDDRDRISCGTKDTVGEYYQIGKGSYNKTLPFDILEWKKENILSLICGLIDSDGSVGEKGNCSIRVVSYTLIQQLAEIMRSMGFERVRTINKKHGNNGKNSFKGNYDLYMVSFRMNKELFDFMKTQSEKLKLIEDTITFEPGVDGRYETTKLHKIEGFSNFQDEYVYDVTTSTGKLNCNGLIQHNCWNYSCYDIALLGLPMVNKIISVPPKYLFSFKSQVEQFVIIAANSTLGATGLADFLIVASYYVDKALKTMSDSHFTFANEEAVWTYAKESIASFIYIMNQPNRGNQSAFTNFSIFDDYFLDKLLPDYNFIDDDGKTVNPKKETVKRMQEIYLDCMNAEMKRTPVTFPVTTACFSIASEDKEVTDGNFTKQVYERNVQDEAFAKLIAEKNLKYGFINIYTGETSTLSSCCRLRSKMLDQYDIGYSNSLGGSSTKVGSLGVCTINLPRVAFKAKGNEDKFFEELTIKANACIRVNNAKRHILKKRIDNGNLPLYTYGFMELSKQYSTIGLNGINEMCSIMGYDILTDEGQQFVLKVLEVINALNDTAQKKYKAPHNCEQIPGESVSVKLCEKDKIMNYHNGEFILYSNQFIPLITEADLLDRIRLQGLFDSSFSGGAICHVNVEEEITDPQLMVDIIKLCARMGVVYWAVNYNIQRCENGHIQVGKAETCYECGAPIKESFTRIVGFLVPVRTFNKTRRENDYPNRQFYNGEFEKTVHKNA